MPLVAAALGSGITAAAMVKRDDGPSSMSVGRQQGVLTASNARLDVDAIYDHAAPSVVYVSANTVGTGPNAFDSQTGGQLALSTGSGFVLDDDGHIVTNDHVVEGSNQFQVVIGGNPDPIPARLMGQDPSSDLADLKVDPGAVKGGLKPLELGDSTKLEPGDQAIAIGSPFGLEGTVTTGIISSLGRTIDSPNCYPIADAVQTDAAINPGNSGGPLLDASGRVVGINTAVLAGGGLTGLGFAVPINLATSILNQVLTTGRITRSYVGIEYRDIGAEVAEEFDLPTRHGVVLFGVVRGSPADRAGLRPGDIITRVEDTPINDGADLRRILRQRSPGQTVTMTVVNAEDRRTKTVRVRLGEATT
ncbi:MAG: S1C family serine protease [Gemmatimonadaceae bacterium]